MNGPGADRTTDRNSTTKVVCRFGSSDWRRDGEYLVMQHVFDSIQRASYIRVRGTNGAELEPTPDPQAEKPWSDLCFYANPTFLVIR